MSNDATRADILRTMIQEAETDRAARPSKAEVLERYIDHLRSQMGEQHNRRLANTVNGLIPRLRLPAAASLTDKIVLLLRETGNPMRGAEITRALEEQGATTTSKKGLLPMVMSSLIRRKEVFKKVARGTYDLTDRK